ncbi:MAG: hypothetical protein QXU69_05330 [Thermofilaceae archaeon]
MSIPTLTAQAASRATPPDSTVAAQKATVAIALATARPRPQSSRRRNASSAALFIASPTLTVSW